MAATLQLQRPTWHVLSLILWVSVIALALGFAGEWLVRQPKISDKLPLGTYDNTYRQIDLRLSHLDKFYDTHGAIECFIIGDSTVLGGINPEVFDVAYERESGQPIQCYTFGVGAMVVQDQAAYSEILVKKYQPRLLIVGISARYFTFPSLFQTEGSSWARYWLDGPNFEGWLYDKSKLYRMMMGYFRWDFTADPDLINAREQANLHFNDINQSGFAPLSPNTNQKNIYFDSDTEARLRPYYPWYFQGSVSQFDRIGHWQRLLNLAKETQLLIFEMPLQLEFLYRNNISQAVFIEDVLISACHEGIPVWFADYQQPLVSSNNYTDSLHLDAEGATIFSQWAGAEAGRAAKGGFAPSHCDPQLPDTPERLGLSPDAYQRFLAYQEAAPWDETVIFNPANEEIDNRGSEQIVNGLTAIESSEQTTFDLMLVLDKMKHQPQLGLDDEQTADLTQWRSTLTPHFLRDLGIEYLIVTDLWMSWLEEGPYTTLHDPTQYELVREWPQSAGVYNYFLYRPLPSSND